MIETLAGRIAVVSPADEAVGLAVALALSARGVRVLVHGSRERALGDAVGEIVYGGGQARHVTGGLGDALARAVATWGRVDFVVAGEAAARLGGDALSPEEVAQRVVAALAGASIPYGAAPAPPGLGA
jgi:NAD(P)-dependent dehydrogenase (short-subunit alcohol dehydrogenase family)